MKLHIMGHAISTFAFFAICIVILIIVLFLIAVFVALIATFEKADIELGKFFEIVTKDLPQNDFESLVVNGQLLKGYRHTIRSAIRIMERIVEYGENNFSKEGKDILIRTVPIYIEKSEHLGGIKPLSIKNALQMNIFQLFMRYILFGADHKVRKERKQSRVYNVFTYILVIPSICFFIRPCRLLLVLSMVSLIFEIVIHRLFSKKFIPFSTGSTLATWLTTFLVIVAAPLFLPRREFLAPVQSIWFYFPLLSIVMHTIVGMWLTHNALQPTEIEKLNSGRYIANHKLLDIIDYKIMPMIRTTWIWVSFFLAIGGTILMYSIIYFYQLSLGDLFYCIFCSASIYFRDGNFNVDTIEGKYFLTEAVASFFINTLYIAYIIQFMFTSRKRK